MRPAPFLPVLLGVPLAAALLLGAGTAEATVVYDSLSHTGIRNVTGLVYGDAATTEFGDAVTLAGTARTLTGVTLTLSSFAKASDFAGFGTAAGFSVPLTVTLYRAGSGGANPTVGSVIGSSTVSVVLPWRPGSSASCTNGDFKDSDGYCYSAKTALVTVPFANLPLPNALILGLRFDPTAGTPASELAFGMSYATVVGTDMNADGVEIRTSDITGMSALAVANVFGPDTGWQVPNSPNVPAFRIEASEGAVPVPEPASSLLLLAALLPGAALGRRWFPAAG